MYQSFKFNGFLIMFWLDLIDPIYDLSLSNDLIYLSTIYYRYDLLKLICRCYLCSWIICVFSRTVISSGRLYKPILLELTSCCLQRSRSTIEEWLLFKTSSLFQLLTFPHFVCFLFCTFRVFWVHLKCFQNLR